MRYIDEEIDELLDTIIDAPAPYETRAEMCAAVVKAARTAGKEGANNR